MALAPYTNSPATLAATAKKIATIPNHVRTWDAASESEVWAVLGNWEEDGGKALANGVALARYGLRDW